MELFFENILGAINNHGENQTDRNWIRWEFLGISPRGFLHPSNQKLLVNRSLRNRSSNPQNKFWKAPQDTKNLSKITFEDPNESQFN